MIELSFFILGMAFFALVIVWCWLATIVRDERKGTDDG